MSSSFSSRSMFNAISAMYFLIIILCSNFELSLAGRPIPPSGPSTIVRPLVVSEEQEDVTMKLKPRDELMNSKQQIFHAREFKACMPKGSSSKQGSTPSRFVNFHGFGPDCSTSGNNPNKP